MEEEARLLCITCKPYLNGEHHVADSQSRPNCHYQYQYMASSIKMGVLSAIPPYLMPYHSPCQLRKLSPKHRQFNMSMMQPIDTPEGTTSGMSMFVCIIIHICL